MFARQLTSCLQLLIPVPCLAWDVLLVTKARGEGVLCPDGVNRVLGTGGHPAEDLIRSGDPLKRMLLGSAREDISYNDGKIELVSNLFLRRTAKFFLNPVLT